MNLTHPTAGFLAWSIRRQSLTRSTLYFMEPGKSQNPTNIEQSIPVHIITSYLRETFMSSSNLCQAAMQPLPSETFHLKLYIHLAAFSYMLYAQPISNPTVK